MCVQDEADLWMWDLGGGGRGTPKEDSGSPAGSDQPWRKGPVVMSQLAGAREMAQEKAPGCDTLLVSTFPEEADSGCVCDCVGGSLVAAGQPVLSSIT